MQRLASASMPARAPRAPPPRPPRPRRRRPRRRRHPLPRPRRRAAAAGPLLRPPARSPRPRRPRWRPPAPRAARAAARRAPPRLRGPARVAPPRQLAPLRRPPAPRLRHLLAHPVLGVPAPPLARLPHRQSQGPAGAGLPAAAAPCALRRRAPRRRLPSLARARAGARPAAERALRALRAPRALHALRALRALRAAPSAAPAQALARQAAPLAAAQPSGPGRVSRLWRTARALAGRARPPRPAGQPVAAPAARRWGRRPAQAVLRSCQGPCQPRPAGAAVAPPPGAGPLPAPCCLPARSRTRFSLLTDTCFPVRAGRRGGCARVAARRQVVQRQLHRAGARAGSPHQARWILAQRDSGENIQARARAHRDCSHSSCAPSGSGSLLVEAAGWPLSCTGGLMLFFAVRSTASSRPSAALSWFCNHDAMPADAPWRTPGLCYSSTARRSVGSPILKSFTLASSLQHRCFPVL